MCMVQPISSNPFTSIDPISTIGFGAMHGTLGIVLGTGGITRLGGMFTVVGHMIGTGITAMPTITITTTALSAPGVRSITDTTTCTERLVAGTMQMPIQIAPSFNATAV